MLLSLQLIDFYKHSLCNLEILQNALNLLYFRGQRPATAPSASNCCLLSEHSELGERCFRVFTPAGNKTYGLWGGLRHAEACKMPQCFAGAVRTSHRA